MTWRWFMAKLVCLSLCQVWQTLVWEGYTGLRGCSGSAAATNGRITESPNLLDLLVGHCFILGFCGCAPSSVAEPKDPPNFTASFLIVKAPSYPTGPASSTTTSQAQRHQVREAIQRAEVERVEPALKGYLHLR